MVGDPWKLNVTYARDGLVVGMIGPVCVAIWRTKPTLERFHAQRLELASAVKEHPGKAGFLCVVEAACDPPEQDVRDASSAMISSHGKNLKACACVIEAAGFRGAIARTVLTGMSLVARNSAPTRVFDGVPAAAEWLTERLAGERKAGLADRVELARMRLAPG